MSLKQNGRATMIEDCSKTLNKNDVEISETSKINEELDTLLRKKAHKQLGNYLMRYYSDNTAARFKIWKQHYINSGQKEKLMLRMI